MMQVKFRKLHPDAIAPAYAQPEDAGMDLCSVEESFVLHPGRVCVVGTGIAVELPKGTELQIRPRSGLAAKYGLTVVNSPGTIDAGYRGEIKVVLYMLNNGDQTLPIAKGMKIAQGVLAPVIHASMVEVDELGVSDRGTNGFGSTGV